MANVAISKQSKRSSRKSFKLNLPFLCRQADVSAPTEVSPPSFRTKDRTDELREVFRHFDRDRDGKISGGELRAFFMSIGEEIPVEEAEAAISELDSDGDRLLDFGDFVGLMEKEGGEGEDEDLRKAFEMFEVVKGSGRITPRGVQRMLSRLGDERSFEECKAMIRAYDLDGDGELDFHEFHRMMS
ncbi:Calmodulin-like protein [Cocos nucifera]|uniref:Calmodulin-like protein n=1 Tax=Cocos nucifera TaxID=13894 RepID=A0A8K0IEP6_COCNU|nr:Calmodulin-like protein [Cocos nucifera]